jgi:hypothetical protein
MRAFALAAVILAGACSTAQRPAFPAGGSTVSTVFVAPSTPSTGAIRPVPARASRSGRHVAIATAGPDGDRAEWERLIWELWGVSAVTALRVVGCESRWDPNSVNPRSGATGLFQILAGPLDPEENIGLAYRMWLTRSWSPWNASRSCWAAV